MSPENTQPPVSEVISIGDELTSGQRLDTNSQWLSQQMGDIGLQTLVHTTVSDNTQAMATAICHASRRSSIVLVTGGLGPTADDLTRQVIADVAGVSLQHDRATEQHIRDLFAARDREMPENNLVQAKIPSGAQIIPNGTGTAPGIDYLFEYGDHRCRLFALPGVPAELKRMWHDDVRPRIMAHLPDLGLIVHHSIHCFGLAESDVEARLPDIVRRGRIPAVGITATKATITLRISASGSSESECLTLIHPTATLIRETFGDLVFGENGITLQNVVIDQLRQQQRTFGVVDLGGCGMVADLLQDADMEGTVYRGCISLGHATSGLAEHNQLLARAIKLFECDLILLLGPTFEHSGILKRDVSISDGSKEIRHRCSVSANPAILVQRSIKQALNFMRLALLRQKI